MISLKDKLRGCIAASWIGSSMGAAVEGWTREQIKEKYGIFDKLVPYEHYGNGWLRMAGTTEDGIERQRLIATAIIEKKGRILAQDLLAIWKRDLHPEKMAYKQEAFDRSFLELVRAGVPPSELGRLWSFPNVVAMARASHPIGLINAGDPQGAADDSYEVGKVYSGETTFALRWAALYNAAIAEACKPDATVESVIDIAKQYATYRAESGSLYALYDNIEWEVNNAFDIAGKHTDPLKMRDEFYKFYEGGWYFNYGASQANEVVSKGLAIFALTKGDPREAIITAVNFGRDTDCLAAVAGGLSGALSGIQSLPEEWINQVNVAVIQDPYTNSRRTIEETAEGLTDAYITRLRKMKEYLSMMNTSDYCASKSD